MAVLGVCVGQCGNQLGQEMYDTLFNELVKSDLALQHYFRQTIPGKWTARCVLIDMEPKVIQRCLEAKTTDSTGRKTSSQEQKRASKAPVPSRQNSESLSEGCLGHSTHATGSKNKKDWSWCFDARNAFFQQEGSGNNWAFGYNHHFLKHEAKILNTIRQEVEKADHLDTILMIQSVAGGTGSGVGAHLNSRLKDLYPYATSMNICVWPFEAGEVAVQNFNSALSLSSIYDNSDAIMFVENDRMQCQSKRTLGYGDPSFEAINSAICSSLVPVLLPIKEASHSCVAESPLANLARDLCPHPAYKLLTSRFAPQNPTASREYSCETYAGLIRRMHAMFSNCSVIDMEGATDLIDRRYNLSKHANEDGKCTTLNDLKLEVIPPASQGFYQKALFAPAVNANKNMPISPLVLTPDKTPFTALTGSQTPPKHPAVISYSSVNTVNYCESQSMLERMTNASTGYRSDRTGNSAFSCQAFIRGKDANNADVELFKTSIRYSPLALCPLKVHYDGIRVFSYPESVSLLSNCQTPILALQNTLENGCEMLFSNAYVHWYEQHGISRADIEDSFHDLRQHIYSYLTLGHIL